MPTAVSYGTPARAPTPCQPVTCRLESRGGAGLPAPVVRLWLVAEHDNVVIRVWDASVHMPRRRSADPESEHGRGLMLVESLSKQWGACRKPSGKVVWVQI